MNDQLKAGDTLNITHGCENESAGFYIVVEDFSPNEFRKTYLKRFPDQKNSLKFNVDNFVKDLLSSGLIKAVPAKELYLGAYGDYNSGFRLR